MPLFVLIVGVVGFVRLYTVLGGAGSRGRSAAGGPFRFILNFSTGITGRSRRCGAFLFSANGFPSLSECRIHGCLLVS